MELQGNKSKTKKPGFWDPFKQQRCLAWIPNYSARGISPFFISIGIILVPIGIAIIVITSRTSVFRLDYTFCQSVQNPSMTCAQFIRSSAYSLRNDSDEVCQCDLKFELPKPIKGKKVYLYYGLDNFYQNMRKYVSSRDDDQLLGKLGSPEDPKEPNEDCEPFDKDESGRIIFPCGAIANSMFNDSLQLFYQGDKSGEVKFEQKRRGISWSSEKKFRFKNPPEFQNRNHSIWKKFTKPKDWSRTIWDLDPNDPDNNGIQNEDFMVWMRPAPFSSFQKLYRIIEPGSLGESLPAGKYRLEINYTYEVSSFGGRKSILLSATSILGQKNYFQGIFSVSLGGLTVILGLIFLLSGCTSKNGKGSFRKYNVD